MKRFLWAIVALSLASPAWATYAYVGEGQNSASSGSTMTVTYSPAASHQLVVVIQYGNGGALTVSSLKDQSSNSISYTQIGAGIYDGANETGLLVLYISSTGSGITSVVLTLSGNAGFGLGMGVYEYSGLSSTLDPNSTGASGTATAPTTTDGIVSGSITNTAQPAMIFAATQNWSRLNVNSSAGTGFTGRTKLTGNSSGNPTFVGVEDKRLTTSGSGTTATFTSLATSGDTWATIAFIVDEPGGASCTHSGQTSAGALATPNGTSGSYVGKTGGFVTPDCSTVNYKCPTQGNFCTSDNHGYGPAANDAVFKAAA